jgi:hypothetical protein
MGLAVRAAEAPARRCRPSGSAGALLSFSRCLRGSAGALLSLRQRAR